MTNTTPTRPPFKDTAVFGSLADTHQECCRCCEDACAAPDNEDKSTPGPLWRVVIGGVDYITDRYVAVRADLMEEPATTHKGVRARRWEIPTAKPGPSTQPLVPAQMCRLARLGVDICEGDPDSKQHLYLGDEHIGWAMAARPIDGRQMVGLADREELARIATDLPVIENAHPWDTAARLLIWERERQAERAAKGA